MSSVSLETLVTRCLAGSAPKVIVWDEYNRPKDTATFAKLMEVTQEWTLAGHPTPYQLDRRLQTSSNNIAQASRFTVSDEVGPEDTPANEWLISTYGDDIDDEGRERTPWNASSNCTSTGSL